MAHVEEIVAGLERNTKKKGGENQPGLYATPGTVCVNINRFESFAYRLRMIHYLFARNKISLNHMNNINRTRVLSLMLPHYRPH